jgi:hypothetical protein
MAAARDHEGIRREVGLGAAFATVGEPRTLYVVNGGYPGDAGDYQGHVTAINLGTGSQNVFNTLCSNQTVHFQRAPAMPDCGTARSAIWSRPGVVYHAGTNRLFMATGNGNFNGDTGGFNWGDSIVAINPDGSGSSGKPIDAYTPTNQATLEAQDADLGSASPAILPVPQVQPTRFLQSKAERTPSCVWSISPTSMVVAVQDHLAARSRRSSTSRKEAGS